jgi:two-component system chemotaxis response regulator CheY
MRTLIVDDSKIVRGLIRKSLEKGGHLDIEEAADGLEALKQVRLTTTPFDLFVVDVYMPNMDGLELVGALRSQGVATPIIMLTTETDIQQKMRAKDLGATGWIAKPFDEKKFLSVVEILFQDRT